MTQLMAVDPGGTTGWAIYDIPSQSPIVFGEVKGGDFYEWLRDYTPDISTWVVEDYFVRPQGKAGGFQHHWDKGETFRKIGAIEYAAFLQGAEFYLQQPSLKPIAYKHINMEYKKGKKGMHIYDALAHGKLWLVKNFGAV